MSLAALGCTGMTTGATSTDHSGGNGPALNGSAGVGATPSAGAANGAGASAGGDGSSGRADRGDEQTRSDDGQEQGDCSLSHRSFPPWIEPLTV